MRYKFLLGTLTLVGLTIGAGVLWRHSVQERVQAYLEQGESESISLKATRDIPETIEIGAFLAGNTALNRQDYLAAESYYEKVLAADSQNKDMKIKLFAMSGLTGNMNRAVDLAYQIQGEEFFLIEHIILSDLIGKKKYKEALEYIESGKAKTFSQVFKQLALAWIYAGLEEKNKAFDALTSIPDNLKWVKIQHKAMLHAYFGEITTSKETISLFAQEEIPFADIWYYILRIMSLSGVQENESLHQKLQNTAKTYILLPEIIKQSELMKSIGPRTGIANALYLMYLSIAQLPPSADKVEKYRGRFEDALIFINMALYLDDFSLYQFVSAEHSEWLKLYKRSINLYDSLLKYPRPVQIVEWLRLKKADALVKQHRFKAAYRLLYQMMDAGSHNPLVYQRLIDISTAVGNYKDALIYFDKLIPFMIPNAKPETLSRLYTDRSTVYYHLNEKEAMVNDLLRALRYNEKNVEALNSLGYEWIETGSNVAEGLQMALKANELSPNVPYILDSVAWGYYKLKNYENALKYGKDAVKGVHESALIEMHLGDIYQALNRNTEAQAQYRKALMIKKDLPLADKKRLKLFLNEEADNDESDTESVNP